MTALGFENAAAPTSDERILAAVYHGGWCFGGWPETIAVVVWWLKGKPHFVSSRMVQDGMVCMLASPVFVAALAVHVGFTWAAAVTGAPLTAMPGAIVSIASGGLLFGLCVLESLVNTITAIQGRYWGNPIVRAVARAYAASKVSSPVGELDRLLAARSYFSLIYAVIFFFRAPKDAKHVRFHALQGAALSLLWGPLFFALIWLMGACLPNRDRGFHYGLALPLAASVPLLALGIAAAIACLRGAHRAASGLPYRVPLVASLADRIA